MNINVAFDPGAARYCDGWFGPDMMVRIVVVMMATALRLGLMTTETMMIRMIAIGCWCWDDEDVG